MLFFFEVDLIINLICLLLLNVLRKVLVIVFGFFCFRYDFVLKINKNVKGWDCCFMFWIGDVFGMFVIGVIYFILILFLNVFL